jgi:hypothetical protein
LIFSLLGYSISIADGNDPVLDFYTTQADRIHRAANPDQSGWKYSFTAQSQYKYINNRGGGIVRIDSSIIDFYYTNGKLDSQIVQLDGGKKFDQLNLSYPNIFSGEYSYYFFPNDTGGSLAIGFETATAEDSLPTGFALINRKTYNLSRLYMWYPRQENHKRYSRCFRFTTVNNLVFPDSIWVVGAHAGIFSSEHYRLETSITNILAYRFLAPDSLNR